MSAEKSYFFVFLIAGAAVWWWLSGPDSDELIVYRATCVNENKVLPWTMAGRKGESLAQSRKRYDADRANCVILPQSRTVYKLNKARAEVYYNSPFTGAARLIDCSIFSRTDWTCSWPDGIGKVVIIDGLRAKHRAELKMITSNFFSLRRWQWWAARLYQWVGQPQGSWLIPEQTETHVKWCAKRAKKHAKKYVRLCP